MKKTLLVLSTVALASTLSTKAQTQRVSLYEEWTGENCGPCAATNPGLTTLIDNNQSPVQKIILLRYQVAIPSAPTYTASLYQQNPTEPSSRQSFYYPVSNTRFAPQARLNGAEIAGSTSGHAGNITQSIINSSYAVNAPFALTTSHTFNSTFDSVTITCTITAAQAFTTANPLNLRVALCEREIHYPAPPGSNGEKDFEWVMRKMVPNINGTSLSGTWTNGQNQVITLTQAIPSYIWDKNQISIVAFIQEDVPNPGPSVVRNVHQAAYSVPNTGITSDATLNSVSTDVAGVQCTANFTPSFELANLGTTPLTSCDIVYQVNGGTANTFNWTGTLAPNATTTVNLPVQTSSLNGYNTLVAHSENPNGMPDVNPNLDTKSTAFNIFFNSVSSPITEGFTGSAFPPANFGVFDSDEDMVGWSLKTGSMGTATPNAAKMDFYNSLSGFVDELYLPYTQFTGTNNKLSFKVAYRQYSSENDRLQVMASTDCGSTWSTLYNKAGATLKTLAASTSAFTPTTASQWRTDSVDMSAYDGMNNVLLKMVATSDYGNNMYIDDINISSSIVGLKDISSITSINVFPNPASTNTNIEIIAKENDETTIKVVNALGQTVVEKVISVTPGTNTTAINTSEFANGIYTVLVFGKNSKTAQTLTVNH